MCGMALEKSKAWNTHTLATKEKIDRFGFDGKQLSQDILRLMNFFMDKYYLWSAFYAKCLVSDQQKRLLDVKRKQEYWTWKKLVIWLLSTVPQ